jgi:carbamoyl-phosphate synthase large subunit
MNILVLSAGGPASHGVIKSLRDINFKGKIVSIDSNEMSAGFYLSDKYYVVPNAFNDNYIETLLDIVDKENINLILPTSSNEIIPISKNHDKFESIGVKLFMSTYESIMMCSDKLHFHESCKNDFPLPKTSLDMNDIGFPFFAKPRKHSAGSRGVKVCKHIEDLRGLDIEKYEYIYQEYLPGQEYTIDVLCDMDSNPLLIVPRKRLQTKEGVSTKAEIVKNDFIEKICFDICKFLKLKGAICLQMKEDQSGELKFVEINPRFGGGTYFASLAGVNFMKAILDLINKNPIEIKKPNLIKIMRYYREVIV